MRSEFMETQNNSSNTNYADL